MAETPTRPQRVAGYSGRTVMLVVYVTVVTFAGGWGYLLGTLGIRDLQSVRLFFLIPLQPTPVGLAVYGIGTLGVGLGVLLLVIGFVSRRYS